MLFIFYKKDSNGFSKRLLRFHFQSNGSVRQNEMKISIWETSPNVINMLRGAATAGSAC